ncbi:MULTISPECIES: glutamate ABC transporter substrate-binding protein [unclassified Nocardiopsis]|uniref:glutamate ABC transporter substrate-binding protein n=1 Tax=unclassified Nocardiopsis TaxID=2649073 RepID=UPI00066C95D4|nr:MULTISPECIES: glutamate ABC transporter substrate-binding protein [unclassified Nocardiopsis]MBQ1080074.1 glutamate ABC transporter substrate-binding protein [Nocardiopsis sp. B62]
MWWRGGRGRTVAALCAVAVMALSACSAEGGEDPPLRSLLDKTSITVGVKADQPGVGLRKGEEFEGFDVDVVNHIAEELGIEDVRLVPITSDVREERLVDGDVDMVVATYSITAERKLDVTFAGPYYVARQDILVRRGEQGVNGVADLEGRVICQGDGSNSASRVEEGLGIDVAEVEKPETYSDCVDMLRAGEVDAVSTDDLILAGFLDEDPEAFEFVNKPFTEERYGVGLPNGDVAGCEAVNRAIDTMYLSGEAGESLNRWFGDTDLELVTDVPQFEGCA